VRSCPWNHHLGSAPGVSRSPLLLSCRGRRRTGSKPHPLATCFSRSTSLPSGRSTPDHPRRADFAALTAAEETAGLYHDTTTIGFNLNWERLLALKRLVIDGHNLRPDDAATESAAEPAPVIMLHLEA
jgi:hypothetical protein